MQASSPNPQPMRSGTCLLGVAAAVFAWLASCSHAFPFPIPLLDPYTSQKDVDAINDLYAALGSPDLDGWTGSGGDPCREAWQGVQCDGPNVTAIDLRGADLGGKLSQTLGDFTAITKLDLSNNQIGGALPRSLPPALARLDLSSNSLSGDLPDSMAKLSSLSTLHVQNNQLTGTLNVLQDLPLTDLNVENNQFSGAIPDKLLSVPKFLRNGNHFTIPPIPGSSPTPATPPPPLLPPSHVPPPAAPDEPPVLSGSHPPIYVIPAPPQDAPPSRHRGRVSPAKAAGFSILAAGSLSVAVVAILFTASKRRRERSLRVGYLRGAEMSTPSSVREPPRLRAVAIAKPEKDKDHRSAAEDKIERTPRDYVKAAGSSFKNSSNVSDKKSVQRSSEGPPLHLQLPFTLFTVASLQQYTNGFSDQDLMRETCFGKVYPADRPTGSKLSVLKLDGDAARTPVAEFLKTVHGVAGLRHPNVEELVGCCVEHGQRLLVYKHFSDRTLDDMLRFEHGASEAGGTLRWDARIAVALEAAKALEYLHEGAGKQVVHRHFRPEHVLVDGELRVSVSGCGLAPFVPQVTYSDPKNSSELQSFLNYIMCAMRVCVCLLGFNSAVGLLRRHAELRAAGRGWRRWRRGVDAQGRRLQLRRRDAAAPHGAQTVRQLAGAGREAPGAVGERAAVRPRRAGEDGRSAPRRVAAAGQVAVALRRHHQPVHTARGRVPACHVAGGAGPAARAGGRARGDGDGDGQDGERRRCTGLATCAHARLADGLALSPHAWNGAALCVCCAQIGRRIKVPQFN